MVEILADIAESMVEKPPGASKADPLRGPFRGMRC